MGAEAQTRGSPSAAFQGKLPGSEVEKSGCQLVPVWHAGAVSSSLPRHATMLALRLPNTFPSSSPLISRLISKQTTVE